ncbi:MAG TPA: COX15/CtaA family protein [Tepidisphaeraceae bacterium]|nr:COX15/CtaA family protein [Tepidisphaeraceae bacterium]
MTKIRYNSALHRIALLTACATFPLIFRGGLGTSHGAGMSVPDWPNSYGYNMFLFPPRFWVGGILYEHTHRLMGTVVGLLAIVLAVCTWKWEKRQWVKNLALAVLAAVILQGVLGGLRVVLIKLHLAIIHACFAQAFFCLTALMAMVTSRWWIESAPMKAGKWRSRLVTLGLIATGTIYAQLILGALMRHHDAGLAIPDFPGSYGHVLPPTNSIELKTVNDWRAWSTEPALNNRVTLAQVWLHFAHRAWAIVVAAMVIWFVIAATRHGSDLVHRPASVLAILLVIQFALGILTVLTRKPADLATAHVAVGALVLVSAFTITVRAVRIGNIQTQSAIDHLVPEGNPVLS